MLNIENTDKNNFFEKIVLIIGVLYLYFISRRGRYKIYLFFNANGNNINTKF